MIQSVLFNKNEYSEEDAIQFLKDHNLKHNKIDLKKDFLRFRQYDPIKTQKYRTKKLGASGIEYIIGYDELKGGLFNFSKASRYATNLIYGKKELSAKVNKILDEYGNCIIKSASVGRSPVQALITGVIKIVSSTPYEKLFHLFIILHTDKGDILLEKNEIINMDKINKPPKNSELIKVLNIPNNLTINQLIKNTEKYLGDKFLPYSAKNSNCQHFMMGVLISNNMNNENLEKFVKQNTEEIFKNSHFRKFSHTITDIAGHASSIKNILFHGGKIKINNLKNNLKNSKNYFLSNNNIMDLKNKITRAVVEGELKRPHLIKMLKDKYAEMGHRLTGSALMHHSNHELIKHIAKRHHPRMTGGRNSGIDKAFKWVNEIGHVISPIAKPVIEAGTQKLVSKIAGAGMRRGRPRMHGGTNHLANFKQAMGHISDFVKPVAAPVSHAIADKLVSKIAGAALKRRGRPRISRMI